MHPVGTNEEPESGRTDQRTHPHPDGGVRPPGARPHRGRDRADREGHARGGPRADPLPTRIERYTVLRSPHIDRKSREQFEIRTHKRLIDILRPTQKTIEPPNKGLSLPPGVDIKIRVISSGG